MDSPSASLAAEAAGSSASYSLSPEVHIEWLYSPLSPKCVRWYSYRAAYDPKGTRRAACTCRWRRVLCR